MAIAFGNMLLSMRFCRSLPAPPWAAAHQMLAGFSFSLYCTHIPVLVLYSTVLMACTGLGWQMQALGPAPWLVLGGALMCCIGLAYGFSRLTERHTDAARRWLRRAALPRLGALR